MLFPYTNLWQVFFQPRRLQLFLAQKKVCQLDIDDDIPACLDALLAHIPVRLPFIDRIEFILDASRLHYLIVPWQEGITTPADRDRFAIAFHQQQQGIPTGALRVAFSDVEYGKNGFAALMDDALFTQLSELARRRRLRFSGCRSLFDLLWRTSGPKKWPRSAMFACLGEDQSSFALYDQSQWHSVFSLRLPASDPQVQLATANRLAGLPPIEQVFMTRVDESL